MHDHIIPELKDDEVIVVARFDWFISAIIRHCDV